MFKPQLETFVRVADAGSFNKAADEAHITPPAMIKQINSLEAELGVPLFTRTHRGLALARAGQSFYKDAKFMMEYNRKAIARAKAAMQDEISVIRIGTSPMSPAQLITDLWPQIHRHCSDISFQLVPFENTPENAREILKNLGEHIDVIVGVFDVTLLELRRCAGFEISKEPICCAVSIYHPLAKKERLTLEDLHGENLMVIRRGWSRYMDEVREGKTVIPFFSHNGSSNGANSLNRIAELIPEADVLTESALSIRGSSVSGSESRIRDWAAGFME